MVDQNSQVKPKGDVEELLRFVGYDRVLAEKILNEEVLAEFTERLREEGYSLSLMNDFAGRLRAKHYDPNYIAGAIAALFARRAAEAEKEYTLETQIKLIQKLPTEIAKSVAGELSKVSLYTTSRGWALEANIDLSSARPNPEQFAYYEEGADTILMLPDSTGIATLYLDDLKHSYQFGTYLSKVNHPFNTLHIQNTAQADRYLHIQIAKGDVATSFLAGYGFAFAGSTTPLAPNATYTSPWFNALNFLRVSIECLADQASAANGLRIQQSMDGVNADFQNPYTLAANVGQCQAVERMGQWVRIQLQNGAVAQTALRLAAYVR